MKTYNRILTEKLQKYQHSYLEKLINMKTLQVKKYYLLPGAKKKNKLILHSLLQVKL